MGAQIKSEEPPCKTTGRGRPAYTHLHQHPAAQPGLDQGLGHPARGVGGRAIHFGVILPRKGTAAMGSPAPIGVHDDLAAGQTSVTLPGTNTVTAVPPPPCRHSFTKRAASTWGPPMTKRPLGWRW